MAILLRDLYKETKSTYGLDLIAGEEGLDHLMNWVYISEDPGTLEFLHGGELIITTGVLCGNEYWLYNFIKGLIEHKTCGLIINIGGHLNRSDISDRIRMLCGKHGSSISHTIITIGYLMIPRPVRQSQQPFRA